MNHATNNGVTDQSGPLSFRKASASAAFVLTAISPLLAGLALWRGGDNAEVLIFAIATIMLSGFSIMLLAFADRLQFYSALVALASVATAAWAIRLAVI